MDQTPFSSSRVRLTAIDWWAVGGVSFAFVCFGLIAALSTHTFSFFPDSQKHYYYIQSILHGHWPVLTADPRTMEAHQPPLFALVAAPFVWLGAHWPTNIGVLLVRIVSLLLSVTTVLTTALLARWIFPERRYTPTIAAAIVGLNPQLFVMSAQVNNDGLAGAVGSLALLTMVAVLMDWPTTSRRRWLVGIVAGLAFLTKMSLWPLAALVLLVAVVKQRRSPRSWWPMLLPLGLVATPWLVRNSILYGDPTGYTVMRKYWWTDQHRDIVGLRGLATWMTLVVETYWTRFRHLVVGLHRWQYMILKGMTVATLVGAAFGLIRQWRAWSLPTRISIGVLTAAWTVVFVGVVSYSYSFYQPWGRYLFPVQTVAGLAFAFGAESFVPTRLRGVLGALIAIGLLALDAVALHLVVITG